MSLLLLNDVTATTAAPAQASDGVALNGYQPGGLGFWMKRWDAGMIHVEGAGTGALTFQGIVFLWDVNTGVWQPAGINATPADRGKLNGGTTITGTTNLAHAQPINHLSAFERIALQATVLTGTGMTARAYLSPRAV